MDLFTTGDDAIPSSTNMNALVTESNSFLNQIIQSNPSCFDQNLVTNRPNEDTSILANGSAFHDTSKVDALVNVNTSAGVYNVNSSVGFQNTQLFQLCVVPCDICQVLHGFSNCPVEPFCANVYLECSNAGCNFGQLSTPDFLANVFTAIEFVNNHLSQVGVQAYQVPSSLDPDQPSRNNFKGLTSSETLATVVSGSDDQEPVTSAPPHHSFTETSEFDFDLDLEKEQKFSWPGSGWTKSLKRHPQRTISKPVSVLSARMRLGSSGSTSGYFSGSSVGSIPEQWREQGQGTSFDNDNDPSIWSSNQESFRHSVRLPSCSNTTSKVEENFPSSKWTDKEPQATSVKEERNRSNVEKAIKDVDDHSTSNLLPQQRNVSVMESNQTSSDDPCQYSCPDTVKVKNSYRSTNADSKRKPLNVNRKGNIFLQRSDFNIFERLPSAKRNAYFVYLDDDSCTGNEDTRAFLLAQLTHHRVSELVCLACHCSLLVYDHFPIVDGVLFLSPICHQGKGGLAQGIRVHWYSHGQAHRGQTNVQTGDGFYGANSDGPGDLVGRLTGDQSRPVIPPPGCMGPRQQLAVGSLEGNAGGRRPAWSRIGGRQERYLHALCLACVNEMPPSAPGAPEAVSKIHCQICARPWSGAALLVGGLYTYDIFAATPCCLAHLTCNSCGHYLDKRSLGETDSPSGSTVQEEAAPESPASLPLPFFSQYSQMIKCPFCGKDDYHFVKPFEKYYQGKGGKR